MKKKRAKFKVTDESKAELVLIITQSVSRYIMVIIRFS